MGCIMLFRGIIKRFFKSPVSILLKEVFYDRVVGLRCRECPECR